MRGMRFYSEGATPEFEVRQGSELDVWDVEDMNALKPSHKKIGWVGRNDDKNYAAWYRIEPKGTPGFVHIGNYDSLLAASCAIIALDGKNKRKSTVRRFA